MRPEPGEPIFANNGHRWTWIHPRPLRGRCVCVDCLLVRAFPIRRSTEPSCKNRRRKKRKRKR